MISTRFSRRMLALVILTAATLGVLAQPASAGIGPGSVPGLPPILDPEDVDRLNNEAPVVTSWSCHAAGFATLDLEVNGRDADKTQLEVRTTWAGERIRTMWQVDGVSDWIAAHVQLPNPDGRAILAFRMVDSFGAASGWQLVRVSASGTCSAY